MQNETCQAVWMGCVPYASAWKSQEELAGSIARGERPAALMLLEHPHTYTAGRSTRPGHVLWDEEERKRKGVDLYEVDRGGDVTYHGPGQLVGYPLLRLAPILKGSEGVVGTDTVGYVRRIETALIEALAEFGIAGLRKAGFSGVWVNPDSDGIDQAGPDAKKIASIGVKVDVNRVTRHGFALNVDPDMRYWGGIIACGLQGVAMTSMAACLGSAPVMGKVVEAVVHSFGSTFGYEIIFDHSF